MAELLTPTERITRALNQPGLSDGKIATTIKLGELVKFVQALDEVDGRGPNLADLWRKAALAFELRAMRVEYVIRLLVAAGHVAQEKVDEALNIARDFKRADGVAPCSEAQSQPDVVRALELGRQHAQWSADRSKDVTERRMCDHDVKRIAAAIADASGVLGTFNEQGKQ